MSVYGTELPNLPCALKAAIGNGKRTLGHLASLSRAKGPQSRDKLKSAYGKLLSSTSRVVGQAKRFAKEIAEGLKRASDLMGQLALDALRQHIDEMVPRVRQVMKQTRARIYRGDTRAEGKIVSLFEPATEVIGKRISVAKRRHGLNRCRYRGDVGLKRWVGLGVLADNLINIGRAIQNQGDP